MISSNSILIEKYGSGIKRIVNYFIESGLPKPTFQNQSNGFLVTVYGKDGENVTENRRKYILKIIQHNNTL